MRILIAHNAPLARNGGMSRIMGSIHDHVACEGHQIDYFTSDNTKHLSARRARLLFPWLVKRHLAEAVRRGEKYDIVNIHEPESGWLSQFVGADRGFKLVVTSHGLEQRAWEISRNTAANSDEPIPLRAKLQSSIRNWSSRKGIQAADLIMCLSETDREYITERYAVPPQKVLRIFPAASDSFEDQGQNRSYSSVRNLLFAGTWLERKGIRYLVPAFEAVSKLYPTLTLNVLGPGVPERRVLNDFPESLRARVSVRTAHDDCETASIFNDSDIYLLPSLFEGTPLTLIEGMATGIPLIVSDICGMKDVVRNGENGLLVPPRSTESLIDALRSLVDDQHLREKIGRSARNEAIHKFKWKQVSQPVLEAYTSLIPTASSKTVVPERSEVSARVGS